MDWKAIPSLAALRAFDAFARRGSFSAAARDLNVTHAAVAQHVRALEAHFGETLAERQGNAMALTATGRELAQALGEGFDTIVEGVTRIAERGATRPVNVTLTASFAESWLMPRIGRFWAAQPEVDVRLLPSTRLVDLRRDGIDLAIRFGDGDWPGHEVEPLAVCAFAVVAAPGYAETLGDPTRHKWLFSAASREQKVWGHQAGIDFEHIPTQEMANNGMVLSAVRAGLGLSIQSRALIEGDLARGQLVTLHEGDPEGLGYYIVTRPGMLSPGARAFVRWLKREAAQEQV